MFFGRIWGSSSAFFSVRGEAKRPVIAHPVFDYGAVQKVNADWISSIARSTRVARTG